MTYGYIQYNDQNIIQIDDTYSNFGLIAAGVGTTGSAVTFPTQELPPIISINLPYGSSPVRLPYLTTSQFILAVGSASIPNFNFNYRVYAKIGTGVTSGDPFGIRIYNSVGEATFDSGFYYMNIKSVSFFNCATDLPIYTGTTTITHNVGGTPYVILNSTFLPSRAVSSLTSFFLLSPLFSMLNNTQIQISEAAYYGRSWMSGEINSRSNATFVLAVGN